MAVRELVNFSLVKQVERGSYPILWMHDLVQPTFRSQLVSEKAWLLSLGIAIDLVGVSIYTEAKTEPSTEWKQRQTDISQFEALKLHLDQQRLTTSAYLLASNKIAIWLGQSISAQAAVDLLEPEMVDYEYVFGKNIGPNFSAMRSLTSFHHQLGDRNKVEYLASQIVERAKNAILDREVYHAVMGSFIILAELYVDTGRKTDARKLVDTLSTFLQHLREARRRFTSRAKFVLDMIYIFGTLNEGERALSLAEQAIEEASRAEAPDLEALLETKESIVWLSDRYGKWKNKSRKYGMEAIDMAKELYENRNRELGYVEWGIAQMWKRLELLREAIVAMNAAVEAWSKYFGQDAPNVESSARELQEWKDEAKSSAGGSTLHDPH